MKSLNTLLFLLLTFTTTNLIAQKNWDFGLRLSQNFGRNYSTERVFDDGAPLRVTKVGLHRVMGTGISVIGRRSSLLHNLDLELEGGFLHNNFTGISLSAEPYRSNFLFLNVSPKFRLGERWYLSAGMEGRYQLDGDFDPFYNRLNLSGAAGLEYWLNDRVNLYMNFKKSMVPTTRHIKQDYSKVSHYDRGLELGITVFLGKRK